MNTTTNRLGTILEALDTQEPVKPKGVSTFKAPTIYPTIEIGRPVFSHADGLWRLRVGDHQVFGETVEAAVGAMVIKLYQEHQDFILSLHPKLTT